MAKPLDTLYKGKVNLDKAVQNAVKKSPIALGKTVGTYLPFVSDFIDLGAGINSIRGGHPYRGAGQVALGLGGLGIDTLSALGAPLTGGGSIVGGQILKQAGKQAIKSGAKNLIKGAIKTQKSRIAGPTARAIGSYLLNPPAEQPLTNEQILNIVDNISKPQPKAKQTSTDSSSTNYPSTNTEADINRWVNERGLGTNLPVLYEGSNVDLPPVPEVSTEGLPIASGEVSGNQPTQVNIPEEYLNILKLGGNKTKNIEDQLKKLQDAYNQDIATKRAAYIGDALMNAIRGSISPSFEISETPTWRGGVLHGGRVGSEPSISIVDMINDLPSNVDRVNVSMKLQEAADDAKLKQAQMVAKLLEAQQMGLPYSIAMGLEPKDYAQYILGPQYNLQKALLVAKLTGDMNLEKALRAADLTGQYGLLKEELAGKNRLKYADVLGQYGLKKTELSGQQAKELARYKFENDPWAKINAISRLESANMFNTDNTNSLLNALALKELGLDPSLLTGNNPNGNTGRVPSTNDARFMYMFMNGNY